MCTINSHFGLYHYTPLVVEIKTLPDTAQAIIKKTLDRTGVEGYIENFEYWSNDSFDEHLMVTDKILTNLEENSTKYNPLKCD